MLSESSMFEFLGLNMNMEGVKIDNFMINNFAAYRMDHCSPGYYPMEDKCCELNTYLKCTYFINIIK